MLVYRATSSLCKYGYSVYPQQNQVAAVGVNGSRMNNNRNIIIGGRGGRIRSRCLPRAASSSISSSSQVTIGFVTTTAAAAAIMFSMVGTNAITNAIELRSSQQLPETLSDIPQMLSGECSSSSNSAPQDCKKARIQRPKSRKAESCTIKCVTTCIRGGVGSPGEGPLNVRRPLVVFKQGFRSRQYCLVECSDICNLIGDGDDGP